MPHWVRFERAGTVGFGTLDGGAIHVHEGDLFASPRATGETVPLASVALLTPTRPTKLIGLVNNYREAAAKTGGPIPLEPLWFIKSPSAYLDPGRPIRLPAHDVEVRARGLDEPERLQR